MLDMRAPFQDRDLAMTYLAIGVETLTQAEHIVIENGREVPSGS